MGRSEWGICVSSRKEYHKVMKVVRDHNKAPCNSIFTGEELRVNERGLLNFNGEYYVLLSNGGGGAESSAHLKFWLPFKILYPFDKPDGWHQCNDFVDMNDVFPKN